jgi:D-inositol-3-phosphate glycosyltransferase
LTSHVLVSYHTCPLEEPGEGLAGGMNVFLRELLRGLGRAGVATAVLTRATGPTVEVTEPYPDIRIFHVPCSWASPPTRESAWESLELFVERARVLLRGEGVRPTVVSAHYWMSGVVAQKLFDAPMVLSYHTVEARKPAIQGHGEGMLSAVRREAEARLAREAERIVCFTPFDLEENRRLFPEMADKGVAIAPGIDVRFRRLLPREVARSYLGFPASGAIFLLAARNDEGKNTRAAVDAFGTLSDAGGGEPLLLVAGQEAPDGACPRGVAYLGSVPHDSMPVLYAASDLVLCPSPYESFGLVPMEALSAGIPVIVPRGTYWGEKVARDGGGLAYAPGDPDGLLRAMQALMADAHLRARLSVEGPKLTESFTWPTCTASWRALLSSVARSGSPR